MALRFFFDECADEDVADALIRAGIDVVTAGRLQRKGLPDAEQFEYARQENRVVYTTDPDFVRLAIAYWTQGFPFCGVAFHAQKTRTKRQIIDALTLLDGVYEAADMMNHIEYI